MVHPTYTDKDLAVVQRVSSDLKALRSALMVLFPERDWLINQIMLALLTNRHVLIYGVHGAAKSFMTNTLFDSIVGPGINGEEKQVFSIQLDQGTSKSDIVGPLNLPKYEATGTMEYNVEGYLPTAHFAFLDEVFDAPDELRGLNDLLNEGEMIEGRQRIKIPLMTAIMATNRGTKEIEELIPWLSLEAFNDRVLFVSRIGYLENGYSKDDMLTSFLTGAQLRTTIRFADLQTVSGIVRRTNQFPDSDYLNMFRRIIEAFEKSAGIKVSDRRLNWLTQVVEAEAVLNGRLNLLVDDVLAVIYALAESHDDPLVESFKRVAEPIIDHARKARSESADEAVKQHLKRIEDSLAEVEHDLQSNPGTTALGVILAKLKTAESELQSIAPQLDVNELWRLRVLRQVDQLRGQAVAKF